MSTCHVVAWLHGMPSSEYLPPSPGGLGPSPGPVRPSPPSPFGLAGLAPVRQPQPGSGGLTLLDTQMCSETCIVCWEQRMQADKTGTGGDGALPAAARRACCAAAKAVPLRAAPLQRAIPLSLLQLHSHKLAHPQSYLFRPTGAQLSRVPSVRPPRAAISDQRKADSSNEQHM